MLKTLQAAKLLGVPYYRLRYLISIGKIPSPAKDWSGDLVWSDDDVARAREAIASPRKNSKQGGQAAEQGRRSAQREVANVG